MSVGIGLLTNGISNTIDGKPFFQGATRSIAFSILTYGVSAGIGDAAKAIVEKGLLKASEVFVFQAMAHGFAGGLISAMQGGKFMHGFASGALSSLASSASIALQALKAGPVPTVMIGGLAGGLGSVISGGDFFNGFRYGAISAAFNHVTHFIESTIEQSAYTEATVYIETDGVGHVYLEVEGVVYSYGRYNGSYSPSSGSFGPLGDGVLLKLEGENAQNYIKDRSSKYPTEKFKVKVNAKNITTFYENIYNSGTPLNNNRGYNKFGRVVDVYNLIGPCGNNCTTITYKALNFGGAKVSPAQTPVGMLFDFRLQSYINKGYKQNERLWGPK